MSGLSSAPRLPLSPASPPASGLKQDNKPVYSGIAPNTPPSPPHMSVATKSYVSSYENGGHTNEMAQRRSRSPNFPRLTTHDAPTGHPNHLKRPLPHDGLDRQDHKRQRMEAGTDQASNVTSFIHATNHDREGQPGFPPSEAKKSEDVAPTQSMSLGSESSSDVKGTAAEERALLLCRSSRPRAQVDVSRHLLGTYGLHSLLESVARVDPDTGEKANTIRKSYQGQIDAAGLPGKNKPAPVELEKDETWQRLTRLAKLDDQQYAQQDLPQEDGFSLQEIENLIPHAMELHAGSMPPSTTRDWDTVLGLDSLKKTPRPAQVQPGQPRTFAQLSNGLHAASSPPPQTDKSMSHDRVKTRGKKRSYDDSSYDGYYGFAEGYSGDELAEEPRKRKKE